MQTTEQITQNQNRRSASGRSGSTLSISNRLTWGFALAVAAGLLMATAGLADHKPNHGGGGGGGGGADSGGPPAFGRADFVKAGELGVSSEFNIVDDGLAFCSSGVHPLGGVWDYWDWRDTADCSLEDQGLYVAQSDFDTGGRWIFDTGYKTNIYQRYLVFHWQPIGNSPDDPGIDDILSPDIADSTPGVDNLRIRLNADRLFKEGFDRQPVNIDLWRSIEGQIGRPYSLLFKEDLYILRDPNDPDIAVLTTEGDPDLGQPVVREAELINHEAKGKNNPDRIVGTYDMPMTIIVRRVAATQ